MAIKYDYGSNARPEVVSEPLEPLDLSEATPVLLAKAIEAARKSTDPKVIIPVLDALLKRGHAEDDRNRVHDIRQIMGVMCEECLSKLERIAKG